MVGMEAARGRRGGRPPGQHQPATRTAGSSRATPSSTRWRPRPTASSSPAPARRPRTSPTRVAQARAAAARILGEDRARQDRDRRRLRRGRRGPVLGLPRLQRALPLRRHRVRRGRSSRSHVISALCKACGACVAACPSGAIKARHFTDAADLRADRGGAGMTLRAQDRRLPLQLVLLHRRRPGRHEPHQVPAQRAHHPRDVLGAHRPDLRPQGARATAPTAC